MTCVGERVDGDWKRSLLDLGAGVVEGMRLVVVRMLEESAGVEVVAEGVHLSWAGGAEAAVVEGLALLEEVLEAVVVELARRRGLTILSSDSHARLLSGSLHCPGANVLAPVDSCFEGDLAVH